MDSRRLTGNLMVLTSILIYSFNTNFMKVLMPEWIDPRGLVAARCIISVLGFWLICLFISPKEGTKPGKRDILMMMAGGALGIGGNLLLYIIGLSMTGPVDAFVIRTSQPMIVLALAILFLHSKINKYQVIGIVLGIAGTLYVSLMPHTSGVKDSFLGDILIFIATLCSALFLLLIKPYTRKFNAFIVMKWMSLAALIVTLPFGLYQLIKAPIFSVHTPAIVWFEFSFTLIFATMIAYYLTVKALNYISAFVESAYIYLLPVTGAIVTILMGIQPFSWHDPIALVLILLGFLFINKTPKDSSSAQLPH